MSNGDQFKPSDKAKQLAEKQKRIDGRRKIAEARWKKADKKAGAAASSPEQKSHKDDVYRPNASDRPPQCRPGDPESNLSNGDRLKPSDKAKQLAEQQKPANTRRKIAEARWKKSDKNAGAPAKDSIPSVDLPNKPGEAPKWLDIPNDIWGKSTKIKLSDGTKINIDATKANRNRDELRIFSEKKSKKPGEMPLLPDKVVISHTDGFKVSAEAGTHTKVFINPEKRTDGISFGLESILAQPHTDKDHPQKSDEGTAKAGDRDLTPKEKQWRSTKQKMVEHLKGKGYKIDKNINDSAWLNILEKEFFSPVYGTLPEHLKDRHTLQQKFDGQELQDIEHYIGKLKSDEFRREFPSYPTISEAVDDGFHIPDSVMTQRAREFLDGLDDRINLPHQLIGLFGGIAGAKGGRSRRSGFGDRRPSKSESETKPEREPIRIKTLNRRLTPKEKGYYYDQRGKNQEELVELLEGIPKNRKDEQGKEIQLESIHPDVKKAEKVVPDFMFKINRDGTKETVKDPRDATFFGELKTSDKVKLDDQAKNLIAWAERTPDKSLTYILSPNASLSDDIYREAERYGVNIGVWKLDYLAIAKIGKY